MNGFISEEHWQTNREEIKGLILWILILRVSLGDGIKDEAMLKKGNDGVPPLPLGGEKNEEATVFFRPVFNQNFSIAFFLIGILKKIDSRILTFRIIIHNPSTRL